MMPHIIVGHFGSGKTEIALNEALLAAGWDQGEVLPQIPLGLGNPPQPQHPKAVLVDLDIVNPMFRSTRAAQVLAAHDVRLIHSPFAMSSLDMPVITREARGAIEGELPTIFDVGGDDIGAVALGQFAARLEQTGYRLSYVINARRPFSDTPEQVLKMLNNIQKVSRLQVTEIYCNTHMMEYTTMAELIEGYQLCEVVGNSLSLPVSRVYALSQSLLDEAAAYQTFSDFIAHGGVFCRMTRLLKLPWQ